eukprot:CAMPEP_0185812430 /NCGR_PEP_ID=MMETSP1322-20130828/9335_1 /TAXON_ID=265543 /ORGANISM="Minutocellus polymorphus, Strain RCC2270" /LENGTH=266 /DNA_ID=CAMNT_0028508965 /DNA_START=94 /DNA_END=895 /DNA_ORIENTATION=+
MAAILQCIIRQCLDTGDESGGSGRASAPPSSRRMSRSAAAAVTQANSIGGYSPATIEDPHGAVDDRTDTGVGCGGGAPLGAADALGQDDVRRSGGGLPGLFARLGFSGGDGGRYDTLVQMSGDRVDGGGNGYHDDATSVRESPSISSSGASPLRSASSFDYDKKMRSIPSIQLDEIILPGSALQKKMSAIMAKDLEGMDIDDECVICMEAFSAENPRMPTFVGAVRMLLIFTCPAFINGSSKARTVRHVGNDYDGRNFRNKYPPPV